jgi:hypothetical protein
MTAATFPSFPHPDDRRGWPRSQQSPHCARERGFAMSRAFGPIGTRHKSLPPARVARDAAIGPGCCPSQTHDFPSAAMTKSP